VIKKGKLFESLEVMKFFLLDYVVQHHKSFYVAN
jgi:hypothetical protein